MSDSHRLPARSEVPATDCWDLSSLYANDDAWEADFKKFESQIPRYADFRGKLAEGAKVICELLDFDLEMDRLAERLGTYAFLRTTEDQANNAYQALTGRFQNMSVRAGQAASYMRPEMLAIAPEKMTAIITDPMLSKYRLLLERIVRYRAHTLSDTEESLIALQGEMAQTAGKVFRQLNDADLKFGEIKNDKGQSVELSNSTFSQFMIAPTRSVRKAAFHQYYEQFQAHENTLAATLAGSIHTDVYYARARKYPSALESSLFHDNVPISVYENLISAVRSNLPGVHRYIDMRRKKWDSTTSTTTIPMSRYSLTWSRIDHGMMQSKPLSIRSSRSGTNMDKP